MKIKNKFFTLLALLLIIGIEAEPFDSTYIAKPSATSLLKNANIYDGEGNEFLGYDLLIKNGKIEAIGSDLDTQTEDAIEYDLSGMWVTPGIIDLHSHMGVYSAPGVKSSSDGNESTSPVTADVWAEHSVWTQDPQFH
jgi:imidazolonepropionase-like amidohydrolase